MKSRPESAAAETAGFLPLRERITWAKSGDCSQECTGVEILQLQAAFHNSKSTNDVDLMMYLWPPEALLSNLGIVCLLSQRPGQRAWRPGVPVFE